MDLTTLVLVITTAIAALGLDAIWHPRDIVLETVSTGKLEKTSMDASLARSVVQDEVARISATPTLMSKPLIRWQHQGGIAVALAEAVKLQSIAYAVQSQFGYEPDEYRIVLFDEGGQIKVLVSGLSRKRGTSFSEVVAQEKDETAIDLVRRATETGMIHVDPYLTGLYMLEKRAVHGDYDATETVLAFAMPRLADTPISPQRSLYENLQGILLLMKNDPEAAGAAFAKAARSNPDNVAAALNVAFTDIQLNHYQQAAARMRDLCEAHRPENKIVLSTAYVTWAAALLGEKDVDGAEKMARTASEINPDSGIALDLWADARGLEGDQAGAEQLHIKARQSNATFENYAEIATLYFKLAWKDNHPLTRSPYSNPDTVTLN